MGNRGSWIPVAKFENPTQVAGCTRFVCCRDMITRRTIGYHENAPKTRSRGSRKRSFESPPRFTQVTGVRLTRTRVGPAAARVVSAASLSSSLGVMGSTVDIASFGPPVRVVALLLARPPATGPGGFYAPELIEAWAVVFACWRRLGMFAFGLVST